VSTIPLLLVVAPIIGAVVAVLAGMWRELAGRVAAVAGIGTAAVLAAVGMAQTLRDGPLRHELGGWAPPIGIEYVLDPLSGFIAVVVTVIGLLCVLYPTDAGFGAIPPRGTPLYPLVLLLLSGLLGVVMSGDLFHLFVFLEIYAIASYALVALGGDRAVFAALRYLILGTLGSMLYLLGVGFLYFLTGTLNMADVAERLAPVAGSPSTTAAVILIVVGLGLKAALFPLHVWLPDAHSHAPPVVAALLAAVQVKVAAYALIRILYGVLAPAGVEVLPTILMLLAYLSAAGVVVGSVLAIRQRDIKRMLAWSTVAQLGFIGMGIGMANPIALIGGLLHVLNHAIMKSCLFLAAGGIIVQTGVKEIPKFSGLGRRMPLLMAGFAIAALSMVGVPPTAGFFSKFYLLTGSLDAGMPVLTVVIVGSSLLTGAYFLRIFERSFAGQPEVDRVDTAVEAPARILTPVWLLAASVLIVGLGSFLIVDGVLEGVTDMLTLDVAAR
jgi:multicomponent Na+:H+ antiporter subunit D